MWCAGVLGIDNFNDFYAPSLKRARQALLKTEGVHVADGDVNDRKLLNKLFEACHFSHVLYLSNQVSWPIPIQPQLSHGGSVQDLRTTAESGMISVMTLYPLGCIGAETNPAP